MIGGQREGGCFAQRDVSHATDSHFFSGSCILRPRSQKGTHFLGSIFAVFWALLAANPLPPTPFANLSRRSDGPKHDHDHF